MMDLRMLQDVKMNLVAYWTHRLIYYRVLPCNWRQIFWYIVLTLQNFKWLKKVLRKLLLGTLLSVIIHRPRSQIFHKTADVLPVFFEEVEVEGRLYVGPAQQFVKADENYTVFDQSSAQAIGEVLFEGLKVGWGISLFGRLTDYQALLEKFAHLFERVLVERDTEVLEFSDVVEDHELIDDIFL